MRRFAFLLACAALSAGLAGCGFGFSGLQFVADKRLHITAPRSLALVHVPVTLRWRISAFTITGPHRGPASERTGYFAVFVDLAPVRPGQTLRAVAAGDPACLRTPGCPNPTYLAARGVYTTTQTSLTLSNIPPVNSYQQIQLHEVTIVLLNTDGRRIGESAWYIDFRLSQGGGS